MIYEIANKNGFEFSGWQVRKNGDNHAEVTRCDYIKQTFCEDVPDYPQEFVNQMLAKNSSLLHYAYEDVVSKLIITIYIQYDISSRS